MHHTFYSIDEIYRQAQYASSHHMNPQALLLHAAPTEEWTICCFSPQYQKCSWQWRVCSYSCGCSQFWIPIHVIIYIICIEREQYQFTLLSFNCSILCPAYPAAMYHCECLSNTFFSIGRIFYLQHVVQVFYHQCQLEQQQQQRTQQSFRKCECEISIYV